MKPPDVAGLDVLNELPRTGIWEAWRARQTSLNRIVALKILPASIAASLADDRAFVSDTGRVAGITHSNIVQIYDFRKEGSEYRIMTEFVPGKNLREWIDKSRMVSLATAMDVAGSIAKVMKFTWDKLGIIHGALKPQNILLDTDGVIKIADFGLSHHFHGLASVSDAAPPGIRAVTPNYISPEQCRLLGVLDCRADIYSLGAILYEMITGSMPFGSMPPKEVFRRQIEGQITNPKELNHEIPIEVSFLIEKFMVKDRDRRTRDWDEACQDIERVKAGDLPAGDLPVAGESTVAFEVKARPKPVPVVKFEEASQSQISSKLSPMPAIAAWREWFKKPLVAVVLIFGIVIFGLVITLVVAHSPMQTAVKPRQTRSTTVKKKPPVLATQPVRQKPVEPPLEQILIEDPIVVAQRKAVAEANRMLAETKIWLEENPDYYDEAIGRFEMVVNKATNSDAARESREYIERLRKERVIGVDDVMAGLKSRATNLLSKQKFQEAIDIYENYNGPFAAESDVDREQQAANIRREWTERREKAKKAEAQARLAEAEAQAKFLIAISNAALALLKGDATEAVQAVEAASVGLTSSARKEEALEALAALTNYVCIGQRVMGSFLEQQGMEISVNTLTNIEKLLIIGVESNVLKAEKRIVVGEGEIRQPRVIRFADLAPAEKRRRMSKEETPATAFAWGMLAFQAGDSVAAREYFAKSPGILAKALFDVLAEKQSQQDEEAARQSLAKILKAARAPMLETTAEIKACVNALTANTYSSRAAVEFKAAAEEFRRRYSQTRLIRQIEPILEALEKLSVDSPDQSVKPFVQVSKKDANSELTQFQPATSQYDDFASRLIAANPGLAAWQVVPDFDEQGVLKGIVISSAQLRDISPLTGLTGLTRLACRGCDPDKQYGDQIPAQLSDLKPLANMALTELDIYATSVKDISVLRGMSLTKLNIGRTQVEDLSPIKDLQLVALSCQYAPIKDFSFLAGLPLTVLDASSTDLRDLSVLQNMPLLTLQIRNNKIRDLTPLIGKQLRLLDMSGTRVKSLDELRGMPLATLRVDMTEISDLSPLAGMGIKNLSARKTGIKDIAQLAGMPLEELDITGTKVKDLSPLHGTTTLRQLFISNTDIRNLDPIRGLPIDTLFVDNPEYHSKVLQDLPALKRINKR